jgi:O-Antigen ligase
MADAKAPRVPRLGHASVLSAFVVALSATGLGLALGYGFGADHQRTAVALAALIVASGLLYLLPHGPTSGMLAFGLALFWLPIPLLPQLGLGFIDAVLILIVMLTAFGFALRPDSMPLQTRLSGLPWVWFVLMILGPIVTWTVTPHSGGDLAWIRRLFLWPLLICLATFLVARTTRDAMKALKALAASSAALAALFIVMNVGGFGQAAATHTDRGSLALSLPFLGSVAISPAGTDVFSFTVVLGFALWVFCDQSRDRALGAVAALMGLGVILIGFGRGGMLAAIVGVIVTALMSGAGKRRRILAAAATALLVLAVVMTTAFIVQKTTSNSIARARAATVLDPFSPSIRAQEPNINARALRRRAGWLVAIDHPLGVGFWGYANDPRGDPWAVHNLWLYLVLVAGVPGLVGFVGVNGKCIVVCMRRLGRGTGDDSVPAAVGLGTIVALLVAGEFSPVLWEPYSVIMYWVPIGLALAVCTRKTIALPKVPKRGPAARSSHEGYHSA